MGYMTFETVNSALSLEDNLQHLIRSAHIDFIDFGCSEGGSIDHARRILDGKTGIGIDIQARNVETARKLGYHAFQGDLTQIKPIKDKVRFVMMSHFLEHLSGVGMAKKSIISGLSLARDFIFIQQPFFDADGYLLDKGLKLFWSDWHGHPNAMTSLQIHNILRPLLEAQKIDRFAIYGKDRIKHSRHPAILPASAPCDESVWDLERHGKKPFRIFFQPVFNETIVIINLNGHNAIDELRRKAGGHYCIYDSGGA